jgi:hypothetical protein
MAARLWEFDSPRPHQLSTCSSRRQPPQSGGLPHRKTFFAILICAHHQKILLKEKKVFLLGFALNARAAGFNTDEAKQKLFLREEKDFALPQLFLF